MNTPLRSKLSEHDRQTTLHDAGSNSGSVIWVCFLFFACVLAWAYFAKIDELVRGQGQVIPSRQLQVVQNLEGGIVADILAHEGDRVSEGDVLLRIDATRFESNFQENQLKVFELEVRKARLQAEVQGRNQIDFNEALLEKVPELAAQERELFLQRRAALQQQERVLEQQIVQRNRRLSQARFKAAQAREETALAQKELTLLEPLFSEGVVSEVELLRAQRALLKAQGEAKSNALEIPEVEAEIEELRGRKRQLQLDFRAEAQQALNRILAELPRLSQSRGALADQVDRTQVRSPVDGTVKQLMVNTIGGVVKPGMDIVSIVPEEDALLIETRIRPSDIARLYPGQTARVRFTAYDFAIYGGVEAEVVHISADSIQEKEGESYYLIRVRTERNYLGDQRESLPIIPGMVAQVDIKTGKRSVLDYLLKPIFRAREVALTEP